jgi:hypothetical protein
MIGFSPVRHPKTMTWFMVGLSRVASTATDPMPRDRLPLVREREAQATFNLPSGQIGMQI